MSARCGGRLPLYTANVFSIVISGRNPLRGEVRPAMKRTYFLPRVQSDPESNVKLILTMARGDAGASSAQPQPGNYSVIVRRRHLRHGDEVDFSARPAARTRSEANAHFTEIGFRLEDGTRVA